MHRKRLRQLATTAIALVAAAVVGCGSAGERPADLDAGAAATLASPSPTLATAAAAAVPRPPQVEETPREALGRAIFFDARLSEPAGTSCASCHDPAHAFSGNHGSTVGVALGSRANHFSRRNTPSVLYVKYVPTFHFALEDDDDIAQSPFGGFGWGGRTNSVAEFARIPLLDPDEMNNGSDVAIATKLRGGPYADALAHEYPGALATTAGALDALGKALEAYLTSAAMAPFTSKYDDYLRHAVTLSPLELHGLQLFKDPDKGACNACHLLEDSSNRPSRSMFTNYGYDGLAVPRNRSVPANGNPGYDDLGLCERKDARTPSSDAQWCVKFRTPSLRNVAVRERFMHNGQFAKLRDVVAFYATRSTKPALWYPANAKFDDVPLKYRDNVNVSSLPYNRREGVDPALNDDDVDAIVAFLRTLTDEAYRPH